MTRLRDGHPVDVAWITLYFAALLWIAWEWWYLRLGRPKVVAEKQQ